MILITFSGAKGSGKTFYAKAISKRLGIECYAFADSLKEEFLLENKDCTIDLIDNRSTKETIRSRIIEYGEGQKLIRGDNVWVKELEKKLFGNSCISDLRFEVEWNWISAFDNFKVKIINQSLDSTEDEKRYPILSNQFDLEIINNSIELSKDKYDFKCTDDNVNLILDGIYKKYPCLFRRE